MKKCMFAAIAVIASACAVYAQPAPAEQKPAAVVKVEKIVTAAGVENREPVNVSSSFDNTVPKVFTWTKIASDQTPVKVKHIYYADGKKAGEIELSVNSSPYRVWSWKTVRPGSWKVEVTDEAGSVLSSAEFTVSSSASAVPQKPAASGK